jgi:hypothetical protein
MSNIDSNHLKYYAIALMRNFQSTPFHSVGLMSHSPVHIMRQRFIKSWVLWSLPKTMLLEHPNIVLVYAVATQKNSDRKNRQ